MVCVSVDIIDVRHTCHRMPPYGRVCVRGGGGGGTTLTKSMYQGNKSGHLGV